MANIHVSRSLDQDQRIYRYMSFYDLIDLLTFSQISFASFDHMQHGIPLHVAQAESTFGSIVHQSWTLLDHEDAIDWYAPDMSQPRICIVSSIQALSKSLFTGDATNVFIERTQRVIQDPMSSEFVHAEALSAFYDDTVSIIVSSTDGSIHANHRRNGLRLLVDLKTLLIEIIVSPDASIRFMELASKLVQQTTCAFVSRASRPIEPSYARGF